MELRTYRYLAQKSVLPFATIFWDFCERELVTLGGRGIEKIMAIIILVQPRWNYHHISDLQPVFSGKYVLALTRSLNPMGIAAW